MYIDKLEVWIDSADIGLQLSEFAKLNVETGYLCGYVEKDNLENIKARLDSVDAIFQLGAGVKGVVQGEMNVLPNLTKELIKQFEEMLKKHFLENEAYYREQKLIGEAERHLDDLKVV